MALESEQASWWETAWGFVTSPATLAAVLLLVFAVRLWWRRADHPRIERLLHWVLPQSSSSSTVARWGGRANRKNGTASAFDVWRYGGRRAARKLAPKVRPSVTGVPRWRRPLIRTAAFGVLLARAGLMKVWASLEDVTIVFGGPRTGKALALDTPVPTPSGWTTMGELRDGDTIYDETGRPCRVVRAHAIRNGRPCYEVVFSDGSVIVADAEHQWQVETRTGRKHGLPEKVLTTAEMIGKVRCGTDDRANYSIPAAQPLEAPEAELPIGPYTLGAWLGDGRSAAGDITLGAGKASVADEIRAEGYRVTKQPASELQHSIWGLIGQLRRADLLGNKHIPPAYFRASEAQRRALLAGLLDTDGTCEKTGSVVFYSTRQQLAEDVRGLVATLGYVSTVRSRPARLYGRDCGTVWNVTFCPDQPVFRLARKAERQSTYHKASNKRRFIVDIRRVESVPVRCVTVDSPSSLYLVGGQCITTHNTAWLAGRVVDHPGGVVVTSTRRDLYEMTRRFRAATGPVLVFNPTGVGDLPSTVRFDPLTGCKDPVTAQARAADMVSAVSNGGSGDREFWDAQARRALGAFLHAAALGNLTMADVLRWVSDPEGGQRQIIGLLQRSPTVGMLDDATQFISTNPTTRSSTTTTVMLTLGWLSLPAAADAGGGGYGQLDVEGMIAGRGALYMLGREETHTAPLVAALAGHIAREARRLAALQPTGRLDPPLGMHLDEAALICPVPLASWTADFGGAGITILCAFQSRAQMIKRWGKDDAGIILNNAAAVMMFGGTKDNDDLAFWGKLAGERDERTVNRDEHGRIKGSSMRKVPVLSAPQLSNLRTWRVVVFRRGLLPVIGKVRPMWKRWDVRLDPAAQWVSDRIADAQHRAAVPRYEAEESRRGAADEQVPDPAAAGL